MENIKKEVCCIRNSIHHGNYEQAAKKHDVEVKEYFKKYFLDDVDKLFCLLDHIMSCYNINTGERVEE